MERGADWAFVTRAATSAEEWTELWDELSPGLDRPPVDFGSEIVAVFGVGIGGCREVRLDDVVIDHAGTLIYTATSDPLAPRGCDSMLSGAAMFVIGLERASLPSLPIALYWQDPAKCPGCEGMPGFIIDH
jgi:hypothetical protein